MAIKSTVRPMRIPSRPHPKDGDGKDNQVDLPTGWSVNETNEILNEEGLVMMDIQEELSSEEVSERRNQDNCRSSQTQPAGDIPRQSTTSSTTDSSHQLPPHIAQLLDQLELEEQEQELEKKKKNKSDHLESDESNHDPSSPDFITPTDLEEELDKQLSASRQSYPSTKEDKELESWGKTGLDGLKNIFKSSSQSTSTSTLHKPDQLKSSQPSVQSDEPAKANPSNEEPASKPPPPNSRPKKAVTFAPETYLPSKSKSAPTSEVLDRPQPSPGIILSDIVERPIPQPKPPTSIPSIKSVVPTAKTTVNGKNAHLHPRLASLLPHSLQNRGNLDVTQNTTDQDELTEQEDGSKSVDEIDEDDDDGSSTWSYEDHDEEGDGASWPPDDLDIQTALDLRQAALEYHTKRQGLGLGKGTGPLGGEGPPNVGDEEREWVPIDTRVQAPGVPRDANGQSRFKAGRTLPPLDSNHPPLSHLNDEKVVDGKLFGTQPIIEGPSPTVKGAAIHEIPGRSADFNELDDELTAEEIELLRCRLEALGMDEESRLAAERAGSELMDWMEKARRGELVDLSDNEHDENISSHHQVLASSSPSSVAPSQSFSSKDKEDERLSYYPARNEGPPEIKTAPKSHLLSVNSKLKKDNQVPSETILSKGVETDDSNHDLSASTHDNLDKSISKQLPTNHVIPSTTTNTSVITNQSDNSHLVNSDPKMTKKMSRFKASKLNQNIV